MYLNRIHLPAIILIILLAVAPLPKQLHVALTKQQQEIAKLRQGMNAFKIK